MDELINEICANLDRADWLLWTGYFLEHRALELNPETVAALRSARKLVFAGLLEPGPGPGDRVH